DHGQAARVVAEPPYARAAVRPLGSPHPLVARGDGQRPLGDAGRAARRAGGAGTAAVLGLERRAAPALPVVLPPRPRAHPVLPRRPGALPDRVPVRVRLLDDRAGAGGATAGAARLETARRHHQLRAAAQAPARSHRGRLWLPRPGDLRDGRDRRRSQRMRRGYAAPVARGRFHRAVRGRSTRRGTGKRRAREIVARLRARMGAVAVELEEVAVVPHSAAGKLRAVVCELPADEKAAALARRATAGRGTDGPGARPDTGPSPGPRATEPPLPL